MAGGPRSGTVRGAPGFRARPARSRGSARQPVLRGGTADAAFWGYRSAAACPWAGTPSDHSGGAARQGNDRTGYCGVAGSPSPDRGRGGQVPGIQAGHCRAGGIGHGDTGACSYWNTGRCGIPGRSCRGSPSLSGQGAVDRPRELGARRERLPRVRAG